MLPLAHTLISKFVVSLGATSVRAVTVELSSASVKRSAASATVGTASSIPNVIKRSVTLPLSLVRISRDLPSHWSYTLGSSSPFPALSSLPLGIEFNRFGRLLSCSKYRLSSREGRAVCRVAICLEDLHTLGLCQVARCAM